MKKRWQPEKTAVQRWRCCGIDVAFGEKTDCLGARCWGWYFPPSVSKCRICCSLIKPLGLAATAAALFLTGVILSARKLQLNALIATSTIVKLLVQPFIAWGLVMLLGLHGSIAITAILMMIALAAGFFGCVR